MAQISKPPIPLTMYKHFAFSTVALTACIAMFADSDNRAAMAGQIEAHEEQQELRAASAAITSPPELLRRDTETVGSFGDEADGSAGSGGGGGGGVRSSGGSRNDADTGRISVPGYEQAFIDGLSAEEYRAFLATLPPEMRGSRDMDAERASQRAAVEAASARRAGQSGQGSDAPG